MKFNTNARKDMTVDGNEQGMIDHQEGLIAESDRVEHEANLKLIKIYEARPTINSEDCKMMAKLYDRIAAYEVLH